MNRRRERLAGPMPQAAAEMYRQVLGAEGIAAEVRQGHLPGQYATLWVSEEDLPMAQVLLAAADATGDGIRTCTECGEESPETFDECWSCGASLVEGEPHEATRSPHHEDIPSPQVHRPRLTQHH